MSTADIKLEIEKVIRTMPDDTLESVLDYLKRIAVTSKENLVLSANLKKIFEEDKALLEKLAK